MSRRELLIRSGAAALRRPRINFERAVSLLRAFEREHPAVLRDPNTLGLRAELHGSALQLVISVRQMQAIRFERTRARIVESRPAIALSDLDALPDDAKDAMQAGQLLKSEHTLTPGTAGWNFAGLDGGRYCLSNWHVLCGGRNDVGLGLPARAWIDGGYATVARLAEFVPTHAAERNFWDLAIARYDDGVRVGRYKKCQDGTAPPYPSEVATGVELGTVHSKVGAGSQLTRGVLLGVGHHRVTGLDAEKNEYWFADQLFFKPVEGKRWMTVKGDSGSVSVDEESGQITGLNFARVEADPPSMEHWTIANPLHRLGWRTLNRLGAATELPLISRPGVIR